jgi:hypothetical protein
MYSLEAIFSIHLAGGISGDLRQARLGSAKLCNTSANEAKGSPDGTEVFAAAAVGGGIPRNRPAKRQIARKSRK